MKPPIKAIKKIIKFCHSKKPFDCNGCELQEFCKGCFLGIPDEDWREWYSELKKEVKNND